MRHVDAALVAFFPKNQRSKHITVERFFFVVFAPVDIRSTRLPGRIDDDGRSVLIENARDSRAIADVDLGTLCFRIDCPQIFAEITISPEDHDACRERSRTAFSEWHL